uniref:COesterase domain-containing protein n=1 Tax=Panagrellus redivivus TaxID=6233 RepID=A0A7E4URS0_PANRE
MALNIPTIPAEWGTDFTQESLLKKLEGLTVKEVIDFARSGDAAKKFILENRDSLMDLNPFSMLLEDYFPDEDSDAVYTFNIYVRIGHENATGSDEEVLHAETLEEMWQILEFFKPDIVDVKMIYAYQYGEKLEHLIGRKLEEDELAQLKFSGDYALMMRRRNRLVMFLAKHNYDGSDFDQAKQIILRTGTSGDMPIEVYDVAIQMEEQINTLALTLNLARGMSPKLNAADDKVRLMCGNTNAENALC